MSKKLMASDRLEIMFARNDEYLWSKTVPAIDPNFNSRQIQKWKSRQTALFLLTQLFEKYQLDKNLLNNIQKMPNGRPFVEHSHVDFNISHSGDWVAVIFCYSKTKKTVAIDIEHPQKQRRFKALLDYYADEQEKSELLSDPTKLEHNFYLSWCLREAVLKSQGEGIAKLNSVKHFPSSRTIYCNYCPKGTLHFFKQYSFYLCYFFEANSTVTVSQHHNGKLQKIDPISPLIYHVNKEIL
ncbi:4'-phosphopantetheinyl transferase family protein [Phocoenobacter skyensis]|uniref:4'-phosphopantetheinyl transferase superfamily protein n=2 Tax=Phocoenobacter skyensis TaxID=97481 RepID=A0ABT9JMN3_9PAST|nr:4'-phosphopantetheinyl transferase superfamily protein [Pasteurella skyensis]MDP8079495.1 4'-phosphopantetheinyl transferase superfamily protein [Pasteurella skyensis]MDP8085288.1 4'-phosphopantetheinyl transferase superfamily protein [Pasteurella skyensis]MDP8184559.1 4'-phosphopantetheinyl transferase superfamily protein [Pasteurella skyensis]